jgi:hypothetical protein
LVVKVITKENLKMKIKIQKLRLPAISVLNLLVALGLPAVKPVVAQTSATAKQTGGSGKFSLTGSMNATRALHTSTLLNTGQVLVAGGIVDTTTGESLASAELFNPARGKWRLTGSMSAARVFATATLLPNGEVLVAGGAPALNGDCIASTELFNPATGKWKETGSMTVARCSHTAVLLPNGQVLVAGGNNVTNSNSLNSAELFNPATGSWQATGSLNFAREGQLSAPLQNGNVLVAGGRDFVNGTFTDLASAELFEPSQGKWIVTSSLSIPDGTPFGSLLANGDVLVARAAFFTPATGTWTKTGAAFPQVREGTTATLLGTGNVLLTGFRLECDGCGFKPSNAAVLYEFGTNTYVSTGGMNSPRVEDSAVRLPNGQVLVSGGTSMIFGATLASAELYTP